MTRTYIVQASRGAKQLPSFFLSANVQGITDVGMAARIGLDVIASGEQTFLRETMLGSLEAIVGGLTYHVHAEPADDVTTRTERAARLLIYANDLRETSKAYAVAADAVGLRKDASRYLYSESLRLNSEANMWLDRVTEIERGPFLPGVPVGIDAEAGL